MLTHTQQLKFETMVVMSRGRVSLNTDYYNSLLKNTTIQLHEQPDMHALYIIVAKPIQHRIQVTS